MVKHLRRAAFCALVAMLVAVPADATVTTSTRSITYDPSSPTTVWAITFPFAATSWIKVTLITEPSTENVLTEGTHYSVTLPVGSVNGYVTTVSSYSTGYQLRIERVVPYTQTTAFKQSGTFSPAAHEAAFDKLTMAIQQVASSGVASADIDAAVEAHEAESDPHTGYLKLLGRSGGQTAIGGTASGNNLVLQTTSNATKGKILMGSAGTELVVDDVNNRVGINYATPTVALDVVGDQRLSGNIEVNGDATLGDNTSDQTTVTGSLGVGDDLSVTGGLVGTDATFDRVFGGASDLILVSNSANDGQVYFGGAQASAYDEATESLTMAGTVTAEQLTSTDDVTVTDAITAGGTITAEQLTSTDDITAADDITSGGLITAIELQLGNSGTLVELSADSSGSDLQIYGGRSISGNDLYLSSASGATKGFIYLGDEPAGSDPADSAFDQTNTRLGIGTTTPNQALDIRGAASFRRRVVTPTSWPHALAADGSDCNSLIKFNGSSGSELDGALVSLPAIGAEEDGCELTFASIDGPSKYTVKIDPNGTEAFYGSCVTDTAGTSGNVTWSGSAGKGAWNVKTTATAGDTITIVGMNQTVNKGWYIKSCTGVWESEP